MTMRARKRTGKPGPPARSKSPPSSHSAIRPPAMDCQIANRPLLADLALGRVLAIAAASDNIRETMIAFDTLSAATRLRQEAGFSEDQARVLVDTFAQCVDESLATKRHVKATEEVLRREMQRLEASLRGDLASLRGDLASLRGDLEQTEASLRAEITGVRGDLEQTEASLRAEITGVRGDLEKTEASLRAEITGVRGDLEKTEAALRGDMEQMEKSLRKDMQRMEESLRSDMRALEHRMTIKLGGIVSLALGILVALEALVF